MEVEFFGTRHKLELFEFASLVTLTNSTEKVTHDKKKLLRQER